MLQSEHKREVVARNRLVETYRCFSHSSHLLTCMHYGLTCFFFFSCGIACSPTPAYLLVAWQSVFKRANQVEKLALKRADEKGPSSHHRDM